MGHNKNILLIFFVLGITSFLLNCASKPEIAPAIKVEQPAEKEKAIAKEGWEIEWERVQKEAKKEGSAVIYTTSGTEVRTALRNAFKQKHGVELEFIAGRTAELVARLTNERRVGLYMADLYMGGTSEPVTLLKPGGFLEPIKPVLVLPEVLESKAWYGGDLPWADSERDTIFRFLAYPIGLIIINNPMVQKEEIRSLYDLLNPKWKGKIVMNDPTTPGSGGRAFAVIGWDMLNLEYWRSFAQQEPVITRDQRLLVEWVARGKYPIAFAARPPEVTEFKRAGAPIEYIVPQEGSYISSGSGAISLINKAPHPYAAKAFLNWLLSREGQIVFTQAHGGHSARLDVPTEGLVPELLRQPGVKYFLGADTEEWLPKEPERIKVARDIFGHLIK